MKLITNWTKQEKEALRKKIERILHAYTILDIRVVGSYVFGDDARDMDVVVFVDEDIEDFRVTDTHDEIVLDLWVHKKTPNLIKLFEMKELGTFDLPQYSLYSNEMIVGKQKDIDRWNAHKRGEFVEWKDNRIMNGKIPMSKDIQLFQSENGGVIAVRHYNKAHRNLFLLSTPRKLWF